MKKYGKKSADLIRQKKSFFEENQKHMEKQRHITEIYIKQPKRGNCKNCNFIIDVDVVDFEKGGIGYCICDNCSHLNGIYDDTSDFCESVYTGDDGKKYGENYTSQDINDYDYRTTSLYTPKVEFLHSSLLNDNVNPDVLEYLDFGTGTGYFVSALSKMGLKNISGTEVSPSQVDLGNHMIGGELLKTHKLEDTNKVIKETTAQVVSMIGVLEHLQRPREVMKEIKDNENIKYVYISVPLFSLSVFLEMLSPDVFHRHLSCTHTHLYTKESLDFLSNEFGFSIIDEWWFGSDIVDLSRHISVNMKKHNTSNKVMDKFSEKFTPILDTLQLGIDKGHFSSEVHLLLKKNK